ncbi:MAG TPA: hypothetical protein VFH61_11160 [Thermoleophilia bacterium]|nr:hypothetical protein [Thermoleophilia bacterium]
MKKTMTAEEAKTVAKIGPRMLIKAMVAAKTIYTVIPVGMEIPEVMTAECAEHAVIYAATGYPEGTVFEVEETGTL